MDKKPEKVTKDPKRQEQGKKAQKTHMKRLKEKILEDNQLPTSSTSSSIDNSTPSTSPHTTRSNDTYVYGVGMLAVLAIGVCVFFAYNTFQPKNKKKPMKSKISKIMQSTKNRSAKKFIALKGQ